LNFVYDDADEPLREIAVTVRGRFSLRLELKE